jgi:hypothetical protein
MREMFLCVFFFYIHIMIHVLQFLLTGSAENSDRKKPREINLTVPGIYACDL